MTEYEDRMLAELKRVADNLANNKTDTDFVKQQIMTLMKNLEASFSNVAQGHNEIYRMITVLTHALVVKGVLTREELISAGRELAEEAKKEAEEADRASQGGPGLVTAGGAPLR